MKKLLILISLLLIPIVLAGIIEGENWIAKVKEKGYISYGKGPVGETTEFKDYLKIEGELLNLTMTVNETGSSNLDRIGIIAKCNEITQPLENQITYHYLDNTTCSLKVYRKLYGTWKAQINVTGFDLDGNKTVIEEEGW